MSDVRVSDLASKLGVEPAVLLAKARRAGLALEDETSTLDERAITALLGKRGGSRAVGFFVLLAVAMALSVALWLLGFGGGP